MATKWLSAFALIAALVVFAAAGLLAADAAHKSTTDTRNASSTFSETSPPVVETGHRVTGTLAQAIPYLAWVAVPLGVLGILTAVGLGRRGRSGGFHR